MFYTTGLRKPFIYWTSSNPGPHSVGAVPLSAMRKISYLSEGDVQTIE